MHEAFDEFRIRDNREFFRMAPEQAKQHLILPRRRCDTKRGCCWNCKWQTALDKEEIEIGLICTIGIGSGEELEFKKTDLLKQSIRKWFIEFRGKQMSLSQSALEMYKKWDILGTKLLDPNSGCTKEKLFTN